MTSDTTDGREGTHDFMEAISAFRDIEALLHEDEETIKIPIRDLLSLLPDDDVSVEDPDAVPDDKVPVKIDSLFYQLSKGKVEVTASDLAAALPAEFIRPQALDDDQTVIQLPLQMVVKAVDPAVWAEKTALKASRHKAMDIPDPFAPKPAAPAPTETAESPAPPPPPEPPPQSVAPVSDGEPVDVPSVPPSEPVEPQESVPEPVAASVEPVDASSAPPSDSPLAPHDVPAPEPVGGEPSQPEPSLPIPPPATVLDSVRSASATPPPDEADQAEDADGFGGVNLNTATREQLMTLNGVTPLVADAVLKYRQEAGRFQSVFELGTLPRVGRKTFRKMTGMTYSSAHRHRHLKLGRLLNQPPETLRHLPDIVRATAALSWVAGCVITSSEGVPLAAHGVDDEAEKLSAVLPMALKRADESTALLEMGRLDSVSLNLGSRLVTAASEGEITFVVVHARPSVSQTQLSLIRKLAEEVAWLLSHRAYAGHG